MCLIIVLMNAVPVIAHSAQQQQAEQKSAKRVRYFYWQSSVDAYINAEIDRIFGAGKQTDENGKPVYMIYRSLREFKEDLKDLCMQHKRELTNSWGYVPSDTIDGILAHRALQFVRAIAHEMAVRQVGYRQITVYENGKQKTMKEADLLADAAQQDALNTLQNALQGGALETLPDGTLKDFFDGSLSEKVNEYHMRISMLLAQQAEMIRQQES